MAIDSMLKATLLCPVAEGQRLLRTLHRLGVVEVCDVRDREEGAGERLARPDVSTEEIDRVLQKLHLILGLIEALAPEKQGFVAGLATVPLVIDPKELDQVRRDFDLDHHYARANELDTAYRHAERRVGEIQNALKELSAFESLPFRVKDLARTRHTRLLFGTILPQDEIAMAADGAAPKTLAWERVHGGHYYRKGAAEPPVAGGNLRQPIHVLVAFAAADAEEARNALARHGFTEIVLPAVSGTVRDRIRELTLDRASVEEELAGVRVGVEELAKHRRELLILKAFWDSCKKLALARIKAAQGRWVQVVSGFVREKDVPSLKSALEEHDSVELVLEKPAPGEEVPISISLPPLVRPVQMLVNLFGLPKYDSFDPSPYLMFSFFLFFGMCFGDVGYGLMLLCASAYIMRRTRPYEGLYNFGKLLFMASIPTIFFGFIFGSFFGDLYKAMYLGEGNPLERLMNATTLVDPIQNPVVVLLLALVIGVSNQFYAIGLKMYGHIKQGDRATAVYDGLLWLIALPGFVLLAARMFATLPGWLNTAGLVLFGVGALGLVLTQGRDVKNPVGRLLTGVLSLYGIVGSYGITAFIGDTMSYCRLLALGLTTSIVALSFNMIAGMVRDSLGLVPFILVLILAHVFNFFISVMGAFVHSMRLILVEYFGRFYEGGAKPFEPLGFDSEAAILRRE